MRVDDSQPEDAPPEEARGTLQQVLDGLMRRYQERVPDVGAIIAAMVEEGIIRRPGDIENDHIAFRTMGVPHLGIASFEKIHPNITIQMQTVPWSEQSQKLTTAIATGGLPDVSMLGNDVVAQYVAEGQLLPLNLTNNAAGVIVKELETRNLVRVEGKRSGQRGQPATLIALNPDGAYSIGVKLGRRSVEALLVDFCGRIMERRRQEILRSIAAVDTGDGAILLTDMFGGTPSNLAISVMDRGKIEVIAGVNLPMLIKLASLRQSEGIERTVLGAQEAGRKYINVASQLLSDVRR